MNKLAIYFLLILIVVSGCAQSTGILKMGPDTYSVITHQDPQFGGISVAKKRAINEANQYCTSLGKEILVSNTSLSGSTGTVDVTFLCLSKGDPDLRRPVYQTAPDVVIENR